MGRLYNLYAKLPDGVRQHTDNAIKTGAKMTKGLRNREQIRRRGEASMRGVRKRLRI